MTGTITSLGSGRFGFIASDAYTRPWKLFFRSSDVAVGFDQLYEGQRVRFDQVPTPGDPSRQRAVRVAPLV
jgi:cold shock CspA family protein